MIDCFNKFVLRTPLFPLSIFDDVNAADEDTFKEICRNEIFMESVFIASPELYEEVLKWLNEKTVDISKTKRIRNTLFKYFSRSTSRCTPFGLFAGISTGKIADKNWAEHSLENAARHTRLDMNFLCSLIQHVVRMPEIQNNLIFYPNSSLYKIDDKWRYIEYYYKNNANRYHKVSSTKNNEFLDKIITESKNGYKKSEYIHSLISGGISIESATEYISNLIENQVLICEMDPVITKPDILQHIIESIEKTDSFKELHDDLIEISTLLNTIDKNNGDNKKKYTLIERTLAKYKVEFNRKYLFQTDCIAPFKNVFLDKSTVDEVVEAMNFLGKLNFNATKESSINDFKSEFYKRYEESEIPLQVALDPEIGIGYPASNNQSKDIAPLIDDLFFNTIRPTKSQLHWNHLQQMLLDRIKKCLENQRFVVELFDKDVTEHPNEKIDFPTTFSAMIELLSETKKENPYIVLNSAGGISAIPMIGRFCHLSEDLYAHAKEIARLDIEKNKDFILAEIIHLPQSRTGNILLHPPFYDYEIPYLAESNKKNTTSINLSDLYVCVRNNRIKLISRSLQKEILPRLSNAHNFSSSSQPVYRFLCDLQYQNKMANFSFTWGSLMGRFDFLPRVVYKNIILSKACWLISDAEAKTVLTSKKSEDILVRVEHWRKSRMIPNKVVIVEGDNELLIDLNVLSNIEIMIEMQKKGKGFIMKEFLHNTEDGFIKDSAGHVFSNQIILSLHSN